MTPIYAWRRCPECRTLYRGDALVQYREDDQPWWEEGEGPATGCPECGYKGTRHSFPTANSTDAADIAYSIRKKNPARHIAKGDFIRKMRGINTVLDHDHRWSKHLAPLCIDCGAAL